MTETQKLPEVRAVGCFLAEYASWLLGCGATCIRIEKNVGRMAEAFGVEIDLTIMPSNIQISVSNARHPEPHLILKRIHKSGISFNLNTQLSSLSWDVADHRLSFEKARQRFVQITRTKPSNQWAVLVLASLANMSFCRLFHGDGVSMVLVFLATLVGYRLKQVMLRYRVDVRVVFLCSAFSSSVIGAGAHLFGWGATPDVAIGTSVLYLIPGIPYINSVSDMLDGHYLCAFSRFIDAMLLTASLSLGLCCGMLLMDLRWLS